MKRTSLICVFTVAVLAGIVCGVWAKEPPVFLRGIRTLGMGGAFTAIADDYNAFFYNPAGICQRDTSQLTIFEMPLIISNDLIEFYNFYQDNSEEMEKFDEQDTDTQTRILNDITNKISKLDARISVGLPNINYLSGKGFLSWGWGIFSQADVRFRLNSGILVPTIDMLGSIDNVFAVPLAHCFEELPFSMPGRLSLGSTFKYIYRGGIEEHRKSILEFEEFEPLLQWGSGMGLDLGAVYQPDERWSTGLFIRDFGGTKISYKSATSDTETKPSSAISIEPQTNIGAAYHPEKIYYWPGKYWATRDRLVLAFDLWDIFDTDQKLFEETFWTKVHMGAEFRWFIFNFRGGFNQGYPTFGLGLSLPMLKLDYAFYADELGRYAGQDPEWDHIVTVAFRFGKATRAVPQTEKKEKASAEKETVKEKAVTIPPAVAAPKTESAPAAEVTPATEVTPEAETTSEESGETAPGK